APGTRSRGPLSSRRQCRTAHALVCPEGARSPVCQCRAPVAAAARDPPPGPHYACDFPPSAPLSFHQSEEGGSALMRPAAPASLLVIVPALNEEGAIAGVVRAIHASAPDVPVLVIDDCSSDSTIVRARAAGAEILPMPHHLGLGGCVQAGYKLAYELGFEYVIRVDG